MADTIFAQASAAGRAGVAVIRISGPRAFDAAEALAGNRPADRRAGLRWLRSRDGARIDQALVLCFPGPGSFTGEDIAELQLHGGPAVCRMVLGVLAELDGLRSAEPGEFTRRALLNGRLDLAQTEGLGDLLAAETAAQQRQAMQLMGGGLSRRADQWRDALVRALAFVEASIDFADDDVPDELLASVRPAIEAVRAELAAERAGSRMAERIRSGFEVALVGAPNVGKSTLLNAMAGREVAITSATAGTTRDVIEVRMDLDGLPVTILDMAGIRPSDDALEQLGIDRARLRAAAADLRLFLVEADGDLGIPRQPEDLVVRAKADIGGCAEGLAVSGRTGQGIGELLTALHRVLATRSAVASTASHARQVAAIAAAEQALEAALLCGDGHPELVAAELRRALHALDFLVGRVDVEAVLDVIFQSFCLGK